MGVNALYSKVDLSEGEPLLSKIPHVHKEDLVTERILGTGQFGKVLKGRLSQQDNEGERKEVEVAVKCLMHPEQDESAEEFLKEVATMYLLNHPNIIKLLGICTEFDQYMILSEFMEHGNLKEFLMDKDPPLSLAEKLFICYQVASGLEYMTSLDIVHRDIAARNCLVGANLVVKVADFGLSRSLAMSNYYKKVGGQVPIRWMSPEAIKYGRYTKESDVWGYGVLMWEVYTDGCFPYGGCSNEEVQTMVTEGRKLHVPTHCTEDVSVLMQAMWESEPTQRPLFKDIRSRLNQMIRNSESFSPSYITSCGASSTEASGAPLCASSTTHPSNIARYQEDSASSTNTRFLFGELEAGPSRSSCIATNKYAYEPGVHETSL